MNRSLGLFSVVLLLLTGNALAQDATQVVWFYTDLNTVTPNTTPPKTTPTPKPVATNPAQSHIKLALTERYIGDTSAEIKGTLNYSVDDRSYSYPLDLELDQGDTFDIGYQVYFAEISGNQPSNFVTIRIMKRGIFSHDTIEQAVIDLNSIRLQ